MELPIASQKAWWSAKPSEILNRLGVLTCAQYKVEKVSILLGFPIICDKVMEQDRTNQKGKKMVNETITLLAGN